MSTSQANKPKPITGTCPRCKGVAVHRCISVAAELYQCRACGATHDVDELVPIVSAPPAGETRQRELFA